MTMVSHRFYQLYLLGLFPVSQHHTNFQELLVSVFRWRNTNFKTN